MIKSKKNLIPFIIYLADSYNLKGYKNPFIPASKKLKSFQNWKKKK